MALRILHVAEVYSLLASSDNRIRQGPPTNIAPYLELCCLHPVLQLWRMKGASVQTFARRWYLANSTRQSHAVPYRIANHEVCFLWHDSPTVLLWETFPTVFVQYPLSVTCIALTCHRANRHSCSMFTMSTAWCLCQIFV